MTMSRAEEILERAGIQLGEVARSKYMPTGARKALATIGKKLTLVLIDDDDNVTDVNWKDFKASDLPYKESPSAEKAFIKALLDQEKQFNKKVDFNQAVKRDKDIGFFDKVDLLFKHTSAKYRKGGIKAY